MQTGPKRKSIEEKKATGTYRASRDGVKHFIDPNASPPIMPSYVTGDALLVWMEELDRVVRAGTTELDSTLFADYCCLAAQVRAVFLAGNTPRGNQLTELRKMRELLGIAGIPSRASRGGKTQTQSDNPFADLMGE